MINHPHRSRRVTAASSVPVHDHESDYASLLHLTRSAFSFACDHPLFATDANLYELYLSHLPAERQVHTCSTCRKFIEDFGGLAIIDESGRATSAFWEADGVPDFYRDSVAAMQKAVGRARVTGPFLSSLPEWGVVRTGEWTHFAVKSPSVFRHSLLTAGQAMAAKREDFVTVARALADFDPKVIAEAIRLLETGHLRGSEKFIAPLTWLADLHAARNGKRGLVRDNILWRAIATAPDGFCHPRAAVTGTLLEDIASGMAFADVKARFDAKMHPLQYQRPQAAPTVGNIAEAEKIVEKMGIARSLQRRFARLDEVENIWIPDAPQSAPSGPGVFSHIAPKGAAPAPQTRAPAVVMTWDKFQRTVLPRAAAIEAYVSGYMNFIALTTAEHADAPPILKWDRADFRNPVAWYVYNGGSAPSRWGLSDGWAKVNAVVTLPPLVSNPPMPHLGEGVVLVLDGCADKGTGQGNALFPECLIGELHAIRASIEAYSKHAEMLGYGEASACGLDVRKGGKAIGYRLRVTTDGMATDYQIDRWD